MLWCETIFMLSSSQGQCPGFKSKIPLRYSVLLIGLYSKVRQNWASVSALWDLRWPVNFFMLGFLIMVITIALTSQNHYEYLSEIMHATFLVTPDIQECCCPMLQEKYQMRNCKSTKKCLVIDNRSFMSCVCFPIGKFLFSLLIYKASFNNNNHFSHVMHIFPSISFIFYFVRVCVCV